MAATFPTGLKSFDQIVDGDDVMEATQVNQAYDEIEALQTKVGVDSSAVSSSHDYKIAQLEAAVAALCFGAWASKSNDTVYQAATDGFVHAYDSAANGSIIIYSDGSNPPTTVRMRNSGEYGTDRPGVPCCVRKGDYWKVTGANTVYWLPFGS